MVMRSSPPVERGRPAPVRRAWAPPAHSPRQPMAGGFVSVTCQPPAIQRSGGWGLPAGRSPPRAIRRKCRRGWPRMALR